MSEHAAARHRRILGVATAFTALLLSLLAAPGGPAAAALATTRVSLTTAPPARTASGATVTMKGSVDRGVRGQKVTLQLRNGDAWRAVTSAKLPRARTFTLRTKVFLGTNDLRVVASKVAGKVRGSTSAVKTTYGVPVAPKQIGPDALFAVSGRFAIAAVRPVRLQRDNSGWETVATGSSDATGAVSFSTTLTRSTDYRLNAPAATINGRSLTAVTTKAVRVTKGPRTPAFAVSTLPPAYRNRMYNYFEGFGSYGGWTVSIVSGSLPPGITLEEGYLEGTPTTLGTYTFRVRIAASGLPPAERTFTLGVAPNGTWLNTDLDVQAVDNAGRYATLLCSSCFSDTPPQVVDLDTGEVVSTATWPAEVARPAAAQVEDISGDGRYVLYFAGKDSWATDNNPVPSALFLWDRVGGATVKIADGGPAVWSGDQHGGLTAAVDGDGSTVAYELTGEDTNDNGTPDDTEVRVWERGVGTTNLSADPRIGDDFLTRPEISDDGNVLSFLQANWGTGDRIRLYNRTADAFTWVSEPMDSTGARSYSLAATGDAAAWTQDAGDDPADPGYNLWKTMYWTRDPGVAQVVSKTISGAPMSFGSRSNPPTVEISGNGRIVYFDSAGDFLENDNPSVRFPYFWDRSTGAVTPMPFVVDDPLDWPDKYERWAETSYDGSVVFVRGIEKYSGRSRYRFQGDPRP
jgi:hypothetical protein